MARIRTIKPEFWDSPGIGSISPWARLLYIAMWNWADDAGRGEANLKRLEGFVFPQDDLAEIVGSSDAFRSVLAEVRGRFGVIFYEADGRPYYEIPSWRKHQRNERIAQGKYPPAADGIPWDFYGLTSEGAELPTSSAAIERNSTELPTSSAPVLKEQGNRGTGVKDMTQAPPSRSYTAEFEKFWTSYPRRKNKATAARAFTKAVRTKDPVDIIAAAARYAADPNLPDASYIPYPATWLRAEGWNNGPCDPPPTTNGHTPSRGPTVYAVATDAGMGYEL